MLWRWVKFAFGGHTAFCITYIGLAFALKGFSTASRCVYLVCSFDSVAQYVIVTPMFDFESFFHHHYFDRARCCVGVCVVSSFLLLILKESHIQSRSIERLESLTRAYRYLNHLHFLGTRLLEKQRQSVGFARKCVIRQSKGPASRNFQE